MSVLNLNHVQLTPERKCIVLATNDNVTSRCRQLIALGHTCILLLCGPLYYTTIYVSLSLLSQLELTQVLLQVIQHIYNIAPTFFCLHFNRSAVTLAEMTSQYDMRPGIITIPSHKSNQHYYYYY